MITSDPNEINSAFLDFHHNLYKCEYSDLTLQLQKEFQDSLECTPLNEESLGLLEAHLWGPGIS